MITFKAFIAEGGWNKAITQGTKLTPAIVKQSLAVLPKFEKDFNAFLEKAGMAPIQVGAPVGSSAHVDKDVADKEYGDIDVLLQLPQVAELSETAITKAYTEQLKAFVKTAKLPYLHNDDEPDGVAIFVKLGDAVVQVDMVKVLMHQAAWATGRMTPEHGLKGALLGNLYSSLGAVLGVAIGQNGVVAKEKGGEWVPSSTLKADKIHTLSLDFGLFAQHIVEALHKKYGAGKLKLPKGMKTGMTLNKVQFSDLLDVVRGIGKALEANELFGKGHLKAVSDYESFLAAVKADYIARNEKAAANSKFNKAVTPEAKKKAEETKELLLKKSKELIAKL